MLLIRTLAVWDSTGPARAPEEWWIGVVAAGHSSVLSERTERGCSSTAPIPEVMTWR